MAVCSPCSSAFCYLSLWRRGQRRPCRRAAGVVCCLRRPVKQIRLRYNGSLWEKIYTYTWKERESQTLAVSALTLVLSISVVGMIRVTNSLVSWTVKLSVWFSDTWLVINTSLSWLPRFVRPICLLKMCSTVSSSVDVTTEICIRMCYYTVPSVLNLLKY